MKKPELLLPAGGLERMRTAFFFGADAVYAGQPRYSLRARNNEFVRFEKMEQAINEAHALGKKFYVTSNLLPHNSKLRTYLDDLAPIMELKPDALIMADPGLIMKVKERWPDAVIHLSVQANTTNYWGVQFWQRMGISRIILSRELSLDEIEEIRQECPDMELEVFVHGALCIAYSGRCLLSGYFNQRDPNQGTCTNSCRWDYKVLPTVESDAGDARLAPGAERFGFGGGMSLDSGYGSGLEPGGGFGATDGTAFGRGSTGGVAGGLVAGSDSTGSVGSSESRNLTGSYSSNEFRVPYTGLEGFDFNAMREEADQQFASVGGAPRHPLAENVYLLEEGNRKGQYMPIMEDEHGTYIMNSKDLRAIEQVERLVKIGVDSLKVEGRTKSMYYVGRVANAYRRAIDDAVAGRPFNPELLADLQNIANRGYTPGFLERHQTQDYQNYLHGYSVSRLSQFAGVVLDVDDDGWATVEVKNRFRVGDKIEIIHPSGNAVVVLEAMEIDGEPTDLAPGNGREARIPNMHGKKGALLARLLSEGERERLVKLTGVSGE
ncbi:peptidase U32 family protein [Taylorella equigenitalis]|uniref:Protease n=1 Tax=Taylorella equigenitalis ATCC 35865 TaxID=743973 RepID=A0ABN4ATT1_9BURK|nr:U32 family peptidase [Taylorella equigenitalis]AFN35323.1 putative protease [Taylorella equigenitalis ATCC 35865]ASY37290.1 U32 family peptidase [Taylorella equigenitalis]ASY38756.1 U32 family peptidase [Taylorella equigenitalis]ASY40279.1 U32 family peptidase [Taylorella equigenitalis]KGK33517.1 protease [Taylorella equigenitalis]